MLVVRNNRLQRKTEIECQVKKLVKFLIIYGIRQLCRKLCAFEYSGAEDGHIVVDGFGAGFGFV